MVRVTAIVDLFLLDVDRARLDFPSLKRRVVELARHWQPRTLLIEDKSSGTALIQQLRAEPNGIVYPTAFVPRDDKLTRFHAQSAWIEAGHVWLPEQASWLEELRIELASFPQGRNDDQVDSLSQFLAWHFGREGHGNAAGAFGGHLTALECCQLMLTDAEPLRDLRYRISTFSNLGQRITLELITEVGLPHRRLLTLN